MYALYKYKDYDTEKMRVFEFLKHKIQCYISILATLAFLLIYSIFVIYIYIYIYIYSVRRIEVPYYICPFYFYEKITWFEGWLHWK